MRRRVFFLATLLTAATWLAAGCSQGAPPAAPSAAAPSKVAEPTKAAVAPTSAASTKKVDFPTKGKSITMIVGYAAGGSAGVAAQVLAPIMEKELGTPIAVEFKAGASGQVAITEVASSKPDGYTIGQAVLPPAVTNYLDTERKAAYSRKSFQMLGNQYVLPVVISVQKDSPYKTMKDLIEAAKAKPGSIRFGTTGILGTNHLAGLQLQKMTGAKFTFVHFDGGAPEVTALLGGHIEVACNPYQEVLAQFKSGDVRMLGVADKDEIAVLSGVKTLASQGYPVSLAASGGYFVPAGTPSEVVDVLATAMKKAVMSDEHQKKMAETGFISRYMDSGQYGKFWEDLETEIAPLMDLAKEK